MKFDKNGIAFVHKPKSLHSLIRGVFSSTRRSFTVKEIRTLYSANLEMTRN